MLRLSFGGSGNFINLDLLPWYGVNKFSFGDVNQVFTLFISDIAVYFDFSNIDGKTVSIKSTAPIAIRAIFGIKERDIW
jgi:hypothetical protein